MIHELHEARRITRIKKETRNGRTNTRLNLNIMNARRNILTGVSVIFSPVLSLRSSGGFEEIHPRFAKVKLKSKIKNRKSKIGFTLVELMVSIAILTAIILIVSTLMSKTRQAVELSQGTIAADADARAAVDRLRTDLAGLTTEGFLAIYTDTDGRQHLVFTAVGAYRSMVDSTIANVARIDYGLTGSSAQDVLWRRAFLLNAESAATTANDHEKISLADYKTWVRDNINFALYNAGGNYTWAGETFDCFITTPSMTLPPNSLSEVSGLWPYLVRPCSNLKIHWTDGTLDGADLITWYGPDAPKKPGDWSARDAIYQDNNPTDDDAMEYDAGDDRYCALWTYRKKDNWPSALRITFTLGTGKTVRTYEVIVDLPR